MGVYHAVWDGQHRSPRRVSWKSLGRLFRGHIGKRAASARDTPALESGRHRFGAR
jgi:hypothetical protein